MQAVVYGTRDSLAPRLARALERALRSAGNDDVEIRLAATSQEIGLIPEILVAADDPAMRGAGRVLALERVAEAVARGLHVVVIGSAAEAAAWEASIVLQPRFEPRPLNRLSIAGLSGSGKTTLAECLTPALGLPFVSLDNEFWWKAGDRPRNDRQRTELVEEIASRERWLAEGAYYRSSVTLARSADLIVHLLPHRDVARARRKARGTSAAPLHVRYILKLRRRLYPRIVGDRLGRALSCGAHLAPVLRVYNDEEFEAVVRGLLRGGAARQDEQA